MEDFWINWGISTVMTAIQMAVKNPQKKDALKRAMLKVYTAIKALYAGDRDFQ